MNQQTLLITVPFLANLALDQIRHYPIRCNMTIFNAEFWNDRHSEMHILSKQNIGEAAKVVSTPEIDDIITTCTITLRGMLYST